MDDLLAEFVAETREMLEASESELVAWEANPADSARIDNIFRFVHTVKGNCGFFDFPRLARLSHAAEDALADCRSGKRTADSALVSAVLAVIDRIARIVDAIEAGEDFPEGGDEELIAAMGDSGEDDASGASLPAARHTPSSANDESEAEHAQTPPATTAFHAAPAAVQRSIRLPVDLLDRVMSGVSDMVLARNDLGHRLRQAGNQPTIDGPFERLTSILSDVRDAITRMRMQRIETLYAALPRLVRDLSVDLGKQVMIDMEGGDVELDREMVEMIRDPLTHIIRNAVDHGIEPPADRLKAGKREIALLSIAARQSGNTISIVVSDDGRGLDVDQIGAKAVQTGIITAEERAAMDPEQLYQIIFQPGFSTAATVSNVSGRGVGLDVVRQNLEKIGGSIKVSSSPGAGTLFALQIPLTLSIIAGLTIEASGQRFAIPQSYVEEIVHSSAKALDFARVGETALVTFRANRVPCLPLHEVLGLPPGEIAEGEHTMVMLRLASGDIFALAVDRIESHGDLVIKPLAPAIMRAGCYAGSTLLDDGQPILLLDVTNIAEQHRLVSDARRRFLASETEDRAEPVREADRAMLFTDLSGRLGAVRLELVKRIETAPASAIDRSGSKPRAVIDGMILPLVGLPEGPLAHDKLRLLRLSDGNSELLYAVRAIDDAVTLESELKPVSDEHLVEAVTLIGGRSTALLDGHQLFALHGEAPEAATRPICRIPDGEWARSVLAPLVVSAGYEIAAKDGANDSEDSIDDLVIVFEDEGECAKRTEAERPGRVIRLRSREEDDGADHSIYRYDREALLEALSAAKADKGARA